MNKPWYFRILLILALMGLTAAVITVILNALAHPPVPVYTFPPQPPYASYINGSGIVESSSRDLFIGSPFTKIVRDVFVQAGDQVKKGDKLFLLDDRDLLAQKESFKLQVSQSKEKLRKATLAPRLEEIPPLSADVAAAEVSFKQAEEEYRMAEQLSDRSAISLEESNRRMFNVLLSSARKSKAQASLDLLKAGTWEPDVAIARMEVEIAEANLTTILVDIERSTVRSPIDGTVLKVNIHTGELADVRHVNDPLMVLGSLDLNLRVDVDQNDLWRLQDKARATAYLQDKPSIRFPLEWVRLEPYVASKKNLTNQSNEQVDTRVLQVLYRIGVSEHRLFVGQQLDVYIEASPHDR